MRTALFAVLATLLLAGCGPPPQSKPLDESGNDQAAAEAQARQPSGADKYSPIAKAKHVEADVIEAKEQQDKQVEQGAN